jgi:hypothetical protein
LQLPERAFGNHSVSASEHAAKARLSQASQARNTGHKRFWFFLGFAGCREMPMRTTPVEEYILDCGGFITTRLVYIG